MKRKYNESSEDEINIASVHYTFKQDEEITEAIVQQLLEDLRRVIRLGDTELTIGKEKAWEPKPLTLVPGMNARESEALQKIRSKEEEKQATAVCVREVLVKCDMDQGELAERVQMVRQMISRMAVGDMIIPPHIAQALLDLSREKEIALAEETERFLKYRSQCKPRQKGKET